MEIPYELPLDEGYLRRECDSCGLQFKWHHGSTAGTPPDLPDPAEYFCPYCGAGAPTDNWFTQEQIDYIQAIAIGPGMREVARELENAFKPARRSGISFKANRDAVYPEPSELTEPHDMTIVESPCHFYEPVKVLDSWSEPLHCLVCGERFVTT